MLVAIALPVIVSCTAAPRLSPTGEGRVSTSGSVNAEWSDLCAYRSVSSWQSAQRFRIEWRQPNNGALTIELASLTPFATTETEVDTDRPGQPTPAPISVWVRDGGLVLGRVTGRVTIRDDRESLLADIDVSAQAGGATQGTQLRIRATCRLKQERSDPPH